jgi:cobalt-zinc-cadmium efflux system protein
MEHDHHHSHVHIVSGRVTRALITGIVLNMIFVVTEAIAGLYTHSLSLLTDAGHNLSDVASLALALLANKLAAKKANEQFSFGYRQSTVLVSLVNAGILLFALGAIAYEAVLRINKPHEVEGGLVAIVAGVGIAVNAFTAFLFFKDKEKDINVRGAYLHMASDALVSLGVVVAGVLILYTHWFWLDTVLSLIIVAVIVAGTWSLLKESLRLTLNGVPNDINLSDVRSWLQSIDGVANVHDLHVWAISTTEVALTVHLVMPADKQKAFSHHAVSNELRHRFQVTHTTIQIETREEDRLCEQKC